MSAMISAQQVQQVRKEFECSRISLKTLDLSRDWDEITQQLESLCSWFELEQAS